MYDPNKKKKFVEGEEYELFITKLEQKEQKVSVNDVYKANQVLNFNNKNKHQHTKKKVVQSSFNVNKEASKLKFFKSHKEGDIVNANFKNTVKFGHFFEVIKGFDGLLYDPDKKFNDFIQGHAYEVEITKMDTKSGKVSLGIKKR